GELRPEEHPQRRSRGREEIVVLAHSVAKGDDMTRAFPFLVVLAAMIAGPGSLLTGHAAQAKADDHKGKKEYTFRGKVESIDTKTKTMSVNGENVQGWMPSMTMTYGVDKEDAINRVKVGDQITAKVYEGDFKTLYDVQVVPPKSKAPPAKK